jgi:DNA-binding CsgD family transcriptional regulator
VPTRRHPTVRDTSLAQRTNRESETVKLLLKRLTSKEIADQMSISPSTVKSFLKLIMTKVGATNRMGIVANILRQGIRSWPSVTCRPAATPTCRLA